MSIEKKFEADNRSVYVGNVDYGATAEELEQHFQESTTTTTATTYGKGGDEASGGEVSDLAAIKARVREMAEEAEKIKQMQAEVERQMSMGSPPGLTNSLNMSIKEKIEADKRSVYVGNVDYGATSEELEKHFHGCGSIKRVTILCNKFDAHPKGFAYIEFDDKDSIQIAMAMDESLFKGRQIKVMPKRTNKPGVSTTNRPPRAMRGRGARGRSFRGGFSPYYSGYQPVHRGRYFPYSRRSFKTFNRVKLNITA